MGSSFRDILDAAFENAALVDVLGASPSALQGIGPSGAQSLASALGASTIRKLGENKYFHAARALLAAAGEPPFDPGPPDAWASFFATAPLAAYLAEPRFRREFGPVYYRGRLDGTARVLVVGQDPATDEILAQRVLIGHSGQRVQGFFRKIGITRSYVMINAFLFSIHETFDAAMKAISLSPPIRAFREQMLDRIVTSNNIEAIVAFGAGARHAVENWPGRGSIHFAKLGHPAVPNEATLLADWNAALPGLRANVEPDLGAVVDATPYGTAFAAADVADIPRFDLPFGIPSWHGTGGATQSGWNGDKEIRWTAP